jgi:hypothetical protein
LEGVDHVSTEDQTPKPDGPSDNDDPLRVASQGSLLVEMRQMRLDMAEQLKQQRKLAKQLVNLLKQAKGSARPLPLPRYVEVWFGRALQNDPFLFVSAAIRLIPIPAH